MLNLATQFLYNISRILECKSNKAVIQTANFFNYSGENCFSVPVGDGIFGTSTYKDEVGFFEYTSHSLSGGSYSIWFITKKEVQYGARHLY